MQKASTDSDAAPQARRHLNWRRLSTNESVLVVVIILLGALITLLNPNFLSIFNLLNVLDAVSIVGIAAIGATFVLIGGELDLSVGSVLGLSAICAAWAMRAGIPWPLAIVIGICVGALCGLANGLLVTRFNLSSFIVTLGMLSIFRGIGLLITGGLPISTPSSISFIGQEKLGPVPVNVVLLLALVAIFQLVLAITVFGRRVQAVGDSKVASFLAGLPVADESADFHAGRVLRCKRRHGAHVGARRCRSECRFGAGIRYHRRSCHRWNQPERRARLGHRLFAWRMPARHHPQCVRPSPPIAFFPDHEYRDCHHTRGHARPGSFAAAGAVDSNNIPQSRTE